MIPQRREQQTSTRIMINLRLFEQIIKRIDFDFDFD